MTDLLDPFIYPWFAITFFIAFWLTSHLIRFALQRGPTKMSNAFLALDDEKQRNTITYVTEIIVTTATLVMQIYGSIDVLFKWSDETSQDRVEWMAISLQLITVLYVWELIYRLRIGWPLLVHHLVTLLLIQLVVLTFDETRQFVYKRGGILLGFHATTEQLSFVALFFYRTKLVQGKKLSFLFKFSAIQTFLFKTVATIGSFYVYWEILTSDVPDESGWSTFWKIAFIPLLLGLFASQLYACYILYIIGKRVCPDTNTVGDNKDEKDEEVYTCTGTDGSVSEWDEVDLEHNQVAI